MAIHVLRYDDFSACSSTRVEEGLVAMLLRHRIPCTFAVIPFACDADALLNGGEVKLCPLPGSKAAVLRPLLREGLAEIALHGYCHLTVAAIKGYQEFSDRMPKATQRRLMERGRRHLEDIFGLAVRLYVPPWNALGATTADVLREEGLCVSSNIQVHAGGQVYGPGAIALGDRNHGNQTGFVDGTPGWKGMEHSWDVDSRL